MDSIKVELCLIDHNKSLIINRRPSLCIAIAQDGHKVVVISFVEASSYRKGLQQKKTVQSSQRA